MDSVMGKTFRDERLVIDNTSFVNCTFQNCTLDYHGHPVSFYATRLTRCKYIFHGSAKRTVMFLQETGLMPFDPNEWAEPIDGERL